MTPMPLLDPGTVPHAPLAGVGDLAAPVQPGAGPGQPQSFALLLDLPPAVDLPGAPAVPSDQPGTKAEAEVEGAASDTVPDVLAQLLRPVPVTAPQDGMPQSSEAEAQAEVLPDTPTGETVATTEDKTPSDPPGTPAVVQPQLPEAPQSWTGDAPAATDVTPEGDQAGLTDLGQPGMAEPPVTPPDPATASGGAIMATETTATGKTVADKTDIDKTGALGDATGPGRTAPRPDAAPLRMTPEPEAMSGKPEPAPAFPPEAPLQAETPRPVTVSISHAPAPAPTQTTGNAAPAAAPVIPMASADWPLDLAAELAATASLRSFGNGGVMEIRLDPEALGHVTLRLEVTDGTAHVAIVTQTPEAARLFTDSQHRLAEALARAGLDLGQHSAGTGGQNGQSGRERATDTHAQPGQARPDATAPPPQAGGAPRDRRIDLIA
ncbi:flagellar hook-length control protein FliK [Roseicyclus mahoneyensis]|uniref:Flagellar hook-length control protein FliK n=1 Tax=Roseicyclus mahoneyensis TaxID=164332 RepID=A0A316GJF7_9RHOB|nr:flagellar hook-length control protein FliK [Roseicyclus mahoneyensis]PWK60397.1 flagellar hook-length control protein FliK [Roseicyclus mahoneyensis]